MPSHTPKQAKVMSAISHGWRPTGKAAGIPVKVAKEFHAADKGKKWGARQEGGRTPNDYLTRQELQEYIYRTPRLHGERLMGGPGVPPEPMSDKMRYGQILGEAGAVADPFGVTAIQRALGRPIYGNVLVNESHGLANKEYDRQLARDKRSLYQRGGGTYPAGGAVPYVERLAFNRMPKSGFINSAVPGRTDKHNIHVASGSYVLPADHVSALGQNNSMAGSNAIMKMFSHGGKYGPRIKVPRFAGGGGVDVVPIVVAGGEHILPPELVKRVGNGDLEKGFEKLDRWVLDTRKKHISKLKGLAPPKKK